LILGYCAVTEDRCVSYASLFLLLQQLYIHTTHNMTSLVVYMEQRDQFMTDEMGAICWANYAKPTAKLQHGIMHM